jgi:hypothetical protein
MSNKSYKSNMRAKGSNMRPSREDGGKGTLLVTEYPPQVLLLQKKRKRLVSTQKFGSTSPARGGSKTCKKHGTKANNDHGTKTDNHSGTKADNHRGTKANK